MISAVMTRIYTRTGDDGSTGLIGGQRVRKSDPRIECYGTVDELNAALGFVACAADVPLVEKLRRVQGELFVIGSHLALAREDAATPGSVSLPALEDLMIDRLEMEIDAAQSQLPELRNFILPGGCESASRLHLARTICRRAERLLVAFALDRPVSTVMLVYLNRLSDWLFVQARHANHLAGVEDVPWKT
jgi:cob(I)alamin adenosyltransferase